jgi:DNA-directed RNA polymerase specialized sigma24 family protein
MSERHDDYALVQRCLAGDEEAWARLYRRFHPHLLRVVARMLRCRDDAELVEEIAHQVWFALVVGDGRRLRAYDPGRASLETFLNTLARRAVIDHRRLLCRGGARQRRLEPRHGARRGQPLPLAAWLAEFAGRLSERERLFFEEHLLGGAPEASLGPLTGVNFRKLKQRVRHKLRRFLTGG